MNRLKLLREEKGLNQADIGKILGITSQAYGLYENEKRAISNDTLIILSKFYNCSVDYILGISNERETIEIDKDKIRIGLSASDYTEITDTQKKQIEEFAKYVLKDNLKKDKKD